MADGKGRNATASGNDVKVGRAREAGENKGERIGKRAGVFLSAPYSSALVLHFLFVTFFFLEGG